ncbi:autotransporter assembly complex family protein [Stenotrophomonas sp. SY1]|jgi:translocation and assembly module TamA|uniref:autotransporter assembly complex protein TamA n=1 Tax=Stenotrophomonas sp. SY1 TaxID=477235 RepID=UPI001E2CC655|nr:autotransporter assembly complex family protein [Stenotrophomonas sp. SY1]MCD9085294.1 autotransporter assembly complex protein TamA [Stenotrophomonas sp. SY1]
MQPYRIAQILLFAASLLTATIAHARGTIDKVQIKGLDKGADAEIIENIEVSLSLYDAIGKVQGESRLEYLLSQAERQTRQALEPFGYYNPTISIDAPRTGDNLQVLIQVDKGQQIKVRQEEVIITGPASRDRYLQEDLDAFTPKAGQPFDSVSYEASKVVITRRLAERGYFDADFTQRKVEVTRAENAADIFLSWDSGRRYNMGPTTFQEDYFRPGLFEPLVYWEEGSYWHEGKLDRLRESLTKLDYFSVIDIQPRPDLADEHGDVPVNVKLTKAKRTIYTAGVSYGSESGAGVRGGVERRYVNRRGHKLNTQLDYAQRRKSLITSYRVPGFRWLDGWYTYAISAYDEQTDYIDMRNFKLIASRSGEINEHWTAIVSMNALRERWRYGTGKTFNDPVYQYSTLVYPQLTGDYINVDDESFPRSGFSGNVTMRGGIEGAGSDTSFVQADATLRWFIPVGAADRLILRGQAGTTWTSDLVAMPPSLRYFAGGDRSIRGYAYREVGPRTPPPDNYALGAKNLVVGSAEYEHYFNGGPWGAAVFVDTGSAFDNNIDLHTGVGIGVRWKSPVGPVRIDIARGLNDPDSAFQLYLNIGADL